VTVTDPQPGVNPPLTPGGAIPAPALSGNLTRNSRAERARMPVALDVVEDVAKAHGVCIRPITQRVTDTLTGEITLVDVPCGATLETKCPPCAERGRRLRMHQCRAGWHAEADPIPDADPSTAAQHELVQVRADVMAVRDEFLAAGDHDSARAVIETLDVLDAELAELGVRGRLEPEPSPGRRTRSTKRRQDAPDLPKRAMAKTTLGRTFTGNGGTVYRPSMFLTVTLPSYGRVDRTTGAPVHPDRYDYWRAARDALHFSRLLDRLVQNLRRVAGYDVQYFATVEPQRRLAPHAHLAIRGTIPRALLRQVIAATYHQVWWPPTDEPVYTGDTHLPIWDVDATGEDCGGYLDPVTGSFLPTWDEAMDDLDTLAELYASTGKADEVQPQHVVRFGVQADIKGLISGTPDADRRIGYLAKYLTKDIAHCHNDTEDDPAVTAHVDRMVEALRFEPCSPSCANWLRYGIQPKNARDGMTPGACKAKAHKREHLGYGGRRVLVSRKWSGKTLADHRHERRAFVLALLGIDPDTEQATAGDKTADRYIWEPINPSDAPPLATRLLHAITQRQTWRAAYENARDGTGPPAVNPPLTLNRPKPDHATEGHEPS
jgi:hypothetical protein